MIPAGAGGDQLGLGQAARPDRLVDDQPGLGAEASYEPLGLLQRGELGPGRGPQERDVTGAAGDGRQPGGVHRVLGHPAVGRQLAAHDGDDAAARGQHGVLARQVGGGALGLQQRSQPGEGADHVRTPQRASQGGPDHVEEEPDLALGRLGHVRDVALDRLVGQADVDRALGLGQRQDVAAAAARHGQGEGRPSGRGWPPRAAPRGCPGSAAAGSRRRGRPTTRRPR